MKLIKYQSPKTQFVTISLICPTLTLWVKPFGASAHRAGLESSIQRNQKACLKYTVCDRNINISFYFFTVSFLKRNALTLKF